MPVVGLPPAVEAALSSLVEHNILTSWKITGGKSFTQFTLRFSMADMSDQHGEGMESSVVQYRRKPPSAVQRDVRRRQQWLNEQESDSDKKSMNSKKHNNTQVHSESMMTYFTSAAANISTTRSGSAMEMNTHELPQTDLHDSDVFTEVENNNMVMETSSKQCGLDQPTACASSADNINSGYICDVCQKDIVDTTWFRCTKCFSEDDDGHIYDLCKTCASLHSYHSEFIQTYVNPSDPEGLSCTSCGKMFTDSRTKISKCSVCKFYIMCKKCKTEKKHGHHLDMLQTFTRGRLKTLTACD